MDRILFNECQCTTWANIKQIKYSEVVIIYLLTVKLGRDLEIGSTMSKAQVVKGSFNIIIMTNLGNFSKL